MTGRAFLPIAALIFFVVFLLLVPIATADEEIPEKTVVFQETTEYGSITIFKHEKPFYASEVFALEAD